MVGISSASVLSGMITFAYIALIYSTIKKVIFVILALYKKKIK